MNVFNNREIAIVFWLFILFVFVIRKSAVRTSFKKLIKSLFKTKILISIFVMLGYIAAMIYIFYKVGIWEISFIKNTIIWFLFSGIVMSVNAITTNKENRFKKIIKENFKVIILIEFIVNYYTFPIIIELILMPIVTLIFMLEIFSKNKEKYLTVFKLMKGLQVIIGFFILYHTTSNLIYNYKSFGTFANLKSFIFPILLTLSFLPFIYLFLLYSKYDMIFVRINMGREKNNKLKKYARKKIIKNCLLNLNKTKKLLSNNTSKLMHLQNEGEVDEIIRNL